MQNNTSAPMLQSDAGNTQLNIQLDSFNYGVDLPDLQQTESSGSTRQEGLPREKTLSMGDNKPFPPQLRDQEQYRVEFDGIRDPTHPQNWKFSTKLYVSCIACFGTFAASFSSAIFAAGIPGASKQFDISSEVGTLGTTLFVLGFASGPVLWAPASEYIGRRWPLTVGMVGGAIFTISSAVAKDIQTLVICRFFSGLFGASQLSVVPSVLADLYNNNTRGIAISIYALTVFVGPFSAPFVGGFVASSYLGWRWTLYIPALLTFLGAALDVLFLKETYAARILVQKATMLRNKSGNWAIHAPQEEVEVDMSNLVHKYFARPLRMLVTEPIVLLVSLYMSFIYGITYSLLEAYPYVFENIHGMRPGPAGLTFIGLIIGQLVACSFIVSKQPGYARKLAANHNVPIPEWRLAPTVVGAPVFAAGVFWFGWTGYTASIHWLAPAASGVLVGFGILCIFLPCFNYLVDAYLPISASTVAANIILRSIVAAGFPLFSRQMFQNLGVQWAGTLLGCLSTIMIPIPFVFKRYGPILREKSKLAP